MSFQSSFKDNCRYFAGLYFLYRFVLLIVYIFLKRLGSYYIITEGILLLMLAIHACIRPYKKAWHNFIDTLLFSLLILLNTITLFNYYQQRTQQDNKNYIKYTTSIQVILTWLPDLVVIICLVTKGARKLKSIGLSKAIQLDNDRELLSSTSLMQTIEERNAAFDINYEKHV